MAAMPPTSKAFYGELRKLLPNLPERAVAIDIRLRLNELVEVDCTFHPEAGLAEPISKRFHLEEIKDPGLSTAQPPKGP